MAYQERWHIRSGCALALLVRLQLARLLPRERNAPDLRGKCFVAPEADAKQFEGHPAIDGVPERAQDSPDHG